MLAVMIFVALLGTQSEQAHAPVDIKNLPTLSHVDGSFSLTETYRGKLSNQYEDAGFRMPLADAEYKITGINFITRSHDGENTQHIYVDGNKSYRQKKPERRKTIPASFTIRKSIPKFEDIKAFDSIDRFEKELGPFSRSPDGSIVDGVVHSSMHWRGCVADTDGNLRCVKVFLHTVYNGTGDEIEHRHIHEGILSAVE